jgi:energy-coupling factor transport system ATP-binding protein
MNIIFDSISFAYPSGVQALKDISLKIEAGETIALIGENGAGKSTLVKQINGLLRPSSGSVYVDGKDNRNVTTAQLARKIGFLFQNPDEQLFERSIFREVAFGPRNFGLDSEQIKQRVFEALRQLGLDNEAESHPYDLQYNQRKLIALAATLALKTPILVLDEPTVGQDAMTQKMLVALFRELKDQGRTQIIISHNLDFCAEIAERVIVMSKSRVIADGPAKDILTKSSILNQAAVDPPQIVRLSQALGMPHAALTIPDFVEEYRHWKKD